MSRIEDSHQLSESPARNSAGRARVMLVFSLLRPGCARVQRLVFAIGRRRSMSQINALSSIHFARLAVICQFPASESKATLRQPLQLFESNYNGAFDAYIDSFVEAAPRLMHEFWGTSYGFPWWGRSAQSWCRVPLGRFKRLIHLNEFEVDHYYAAYPEATVTMVGSALRIMEAHQRFRRDAAALAPDSFLEAYRAFIVSVQEDL